MRKLFWIFGGVLLVVGAGAVAVYMGKAGGESQVRAFMERAASRPLAETQAELDPGLVAQADPMQVAAFARDIATRFGPFQGIALDGFSVNQSYRSNDRILEVSGNFRFRDREVPMAIGFRNDRLLMIKISDPEVGKLVVAAISKPPEDHASYRDLGQRFLAAAFGGEPERAYPMMSAPLREQVDEPAFRTQVGRFQELGSLKVVHFLEASRDQAQPDRLNLSYRLEWEGLSLPARVSYQFVGLHSYLVAYSVRSPQAGALPGGGGPMGQ